MSGDMQYRLNRAWANTTQTATAIARLFAEFLAFFDDHPEFDIISYGTGKTESGTGTPTTWKAWADTDGSGTVPFADNSWFVVEAQKASAALNGDGTRKWQAKFQWTKTTGFDDCNVADADYGFEASTHILCARFSPDGGWVGSGTLDFSGVTASNNIELGNAAGTGSQQDFYLHVLGDDDTVLWVGQMYTPGALPAYTVQRMGYMGETVRRRSAHTKPELFFASSLRSAGALVLEKGYNEATTALFNAPYYGGSNVPSFSLAADGSGVTKHNFFGGFQNLAVDYDLLRNAAADPWIGDAEFLAFVVRQNFNEHNSVIGQLRLVEAAAEYVTEGSLWGDGTRLSVGYSTATRGGLAIPWPGTGTSPLF